MDINENSNVTIPIRNLIATGWVCVAGFAVNFLISPLAAAFGVTIPQADTAVMLPVLMGMLGLGTMRTFERVKKNG